MSLKYSPLILFDIISEMMHEISLKLLSIRTGNSYPGPVWPRDHDYDEKF